MATGHVQDDTLIVMRGDIADVHELKNILQQFSEATGLRINYNKSTLVPIHMDMVLASQGAAKIGCSQQSFPQNYLGLPLSANKLPVSAFSTYVDRTDKFLSSWQASLLNNMGRVVLINSVLDSQLVYIMSAAQITPEVIKQIGKRRRSFLWAGNKDFSAAKCLVAWPKVCTTKDLGGLGIRDFGTHNVCLLRNLIHRCGRIVRNNILTEVLVFHQTLSTPKASYNGWYPSDTPQWRAQKIHIFPKDPIMRTSYNISLFHTLEFLKKYIITIPNTRVRNDNSGI